MRIGIIGLAAGLLLAGSAATLAATGPVAGDAANVTRPVLGGVAVAPVDDIVVARRGADDPPGDDRGGRGRDKDDGGKSGKSKDDKGGKGKKGKGRGGKDDGPNHDRNDDHGNHGPNHT